MTVITEKETILSAFISFIYENKTLAIELPHNQEFYIHFHKFHSSSNNQTYIISTTSFFGSNGRAGAEAEAGLGLGAGAGLEVRLRVGAEAGLGLGAEAGVGAEAGGGSSKQR